MGTRTERTGTIIWWSTKGHGVVAEKDGTRYYLPITGITRGPVVPQPGLTVTFQSLIASPGKLPVAHSAIIDSNVAVKL